MPKFYTIDLDYLRYLKQIDDRVPNFDYEDHNKFFFGTVLCVNSIQYFVPISSKRIQNATTMPIKESRRDGSLRQIASIRLSFMLPVPEELLEEIDMNWLRLTKGENYANFVAKEYEYCKDNYDRIQRRAESVYYFGTHPEHEYYKYCCDFIALEKACQNWLIGHTDS